MDELFKERLEVCRTIIFKDLFQFLKRIDPEDQNDQ